MFIDLNCFRRWAIWPMGILSKVISKTYDNCFYMIIRNNETLCSSQISNYLYKFLKCYLKSWMIKFAMQIRETDWQLSIPQTFRFKYIFISFYLQNNYVKLDSEASVLVILSYMTSISGLLVCLIIYAVNWRCV